MKWYEIKANLVLADSEKVDKNCGYRFELPLDENMQLIEEEWKDREQPYPVIRFWEGEASRHGQLELHMHNSWSIKYHVPDESDPTIQLGEEVMSVGELLSIRDHSDNAHSFRITSLEELPWSPTATELGV